MTLQLDPGPGVSTYTSTLWAVEVDGESTHCWGKQRTTEFVLPGFWSQGATVQVCDARFGTDDVVLVRIRRTEAYAAGSGPITSFRVFPTWQFEDRAELQGDEIVISMPPHTKCCVVANGVRAERLYVAADNLTEEPDLVSPLVDIYDGSQVAALSGRTLVFPAGVHDLVNDGAWGAKLFPVESNATIYFSRRSWVIGSLNLAPTFTDVSTGVRIYGPGNLSGEFITNEAVKALPTFDEQRQHAMIFGYVPGIGGTDNEVRDITIWQNPWYAFGTAEVNRIYDVGILSPWCSNCDGLKAFGDSGQSYNWHIEDNFSWTGDDAITFPEWGGTGHVKRNLLSVAGAQVLMFGYQQDFNTTWVQTCTDNNVIACNDYYVINQGTGGSIIHLWIDNTPGTFLHRSHIVIDGLHIDGDELNALFFTIGNQPYPIFIPGEDLSRGGYGRATDITIRNVWMEKVPADKSRLMSKDIENRPSSIRFENINSGGVRWTPRNFWRFVEQDAAEFVSPPIGIAFDITIDGVSLVA